jgi:hypothetical protein
MNDRNRIDAAERPRLERTERVRYEPGTGAGAPAQDARSVGDLVKELAAEGRTLVRDEIALAKTELSEKAGVFQRNLASIAIGAALLLAAVLLLVEAVNRGLTVLLEGWVGLETAVWLAPLVLALLIGMIGWSMLRKGAGAIRTEGVTPHQTVETLKEDKRWAERKVKS